jgi:hypothetical protein
LSGEIFKMAFEILPNCTFFFVLGTTALVTKIFTRGKGLGIFFKYFDAVYFNT